MALVWGSGGAQVITTQNPASVAVAYPTGTPTASRKYGYITYIGLRPDTAAITTPSGWTLLGTFSGGGGTPGGGTGPSEVSVFVRDDQTTATNSGSVTFTLTGSANMAWGYMERWECATTESIDWAITGGVDTTAATPFTFVTASVATDFVKTGDGLIFAVVMAQGTAPTWQLATVTAQGGGTITLGTISQRVAPASTTGNDIGGRVSTAMPTVSSQQLAGTLTYSAGVTGTVTTTYGPGAIVRARAVSFPAVTQAAYRFYADGTETGSTALAAQDTAPTVDLSAGDVNLALRVRLQETAGNAVPATDDFQLQWEKNSSGTWVDVGTGTSTVAGYASTNLTDGGATTSRLTGGTGTFGAGAVSEDGLVDNEGWTASGHTELLYALTLKQADFAASDVLKFRVRRNGVNLDATTVTPTVNITITTKQGTAALTATSTLTATGTAIPVSARWVRDHTAGTSTVSGTTVAATTAAQVDAGNVLVAYYAGDNGGFQFPLVSSISKPGGETATWRRIITHDAGSATANGWSRGELWAIKTTVNWPSSTAVTATIDSSRASKVLLLSEFTGCSVVLRNNPRGVSTTNPISGFDTFGQPTLAGDLVIGCTDFESNVVPSTYSNGTGGAWSSAYTANANTGTSSTSITAGMQWKVPTVDGHQVWEHSRTENGGTVLAVLAADFNAVPSPFVYHVSSPSPPATPSSATGTTLTAAGDVQAGDLTVIWMTSRPASSIPFPPDVGWVLIGSMAIGSDADGEGTGPVRLTAWCRQQNVGESAAPSIPVVTGGVTATFAGVYRKNDSNAIWQYPEVAFGASAAGSSFSATGDESLDAAPGEMIISVGGESNSTASVSSHNLIVPGCAMSEVVYFNGTNTTTGNNLTTWATQATVVSGNQTGPATTLAQTSSGAASRGVMQIKVGATHTSPYVRTNLIENPSFETDSTGWTGGTRTSTLTNGAVPVGTYAYEATGATGSFVRDTTYGAIPVKQGRAYHFRNRVVGPATPTVKVDPVVPTTYAADGTTNTGPMERHTVTTFDTIGSFFANSWTSLVQYVPPPGAAYLGLPGGTDSDRLQFTFATNNATSQAVGIDSVIVEQIGNRAETYFDGDTTDTATWEYQWLGTPHASRSRAISPPAATLTNYAGANLTAVSTLSITPTVEYTLFPTFTAVSTLSSVATTSNAAVFVRNHIAGTSISSGTTVAATTSAAVAVGDLLVAWIGTENIAYATPTVASISKPGGETAVWKRIASTGGFSSTTGGHTRGELWVLKTTTSWADATDVTATFSDAVVSKTFLLSEFDGVRDVLRCNPAPEQSNGAIISDSRTWGEPPVVGDLVLGFSTHEVMATPTVFSESTGGAWSSQYAANASTGGNSTSNTSVAQYKIPTVTGHQTWGHNSTLPSASLVVALVAEDNIEPAPFVQFVGYYGSATTSDSLGISMSAPGNAESDDLSIVFFASRPASSIPTGPAGWSMFGSLEIGSGTTADGQGPTRISGYYRLGAANFTDLDIPSITNGMTSTMGAVYRKPQGSSAEWAPRFTFGEDLTPSSGSFSATGDLNLEAETGDIVIAVGADNASTGTVTVPGVVVPGATVDTPTRRLANARTSSGFNVALWGTHSQVVSGTQTAPATSVATTTASATSAGTMQFRIATTDTAPLIHENLVKNPSFETDTNSWVGTGRVSSLTHGAIPSGSFAVQKTGVTTFYELDQPVPVLPGRVYTYSVRVVGAASPGNTVSPYQLNAYAADGVTPVGTAPTLLSSVTTGTNTWTATYTFITPAGAYFMGNPGTANTGWQAASQNATSQTYGLDTFSIRQTSSDVSAYTYFDGDTADTGQWEYLWTGTPHASTSKAVSPPGGAVTTQSASATLTATSTLTATGDVTAGVATHAATAALTAASTLTATAVREPQSAAGLTATSTLTATAVRVQDATAALTAASTLTATAVRAPAAAVSLLAVSTLTATAVRTSLATAALTAASTLTATAVATEFATAALTATGALATTPIRDQVAAANLAVASTLAATGVITEFATIALTSTATLTATATAFHVPLGAAALLTTSTLTATAVRDAVSTAAMAAVSTLTATGTTIGVVPASAALTATSTLTTTGVREPQAAGTLTAATTLTATAVRVATVAAALNATSTLTATGVAFAVLPGAATLVGQSTLTATAERDAVTSAALTVASTLTTTGIRVPQAAADLTGVSMFTAIAVREQTTTAALSSTAVLTATGVRDVTVLAALSASSTLASAVSGVGASAANLVATSSLTSAAVREPIAAVSLTASSSLTATPQQTHTTTAALATTSTLTATGVREPQATAALTATSTLAAAGIQTNQAAAALTTASTLTATGISIGVGLVAANLVTASTLTATGVRTQFTTTALASASTLTATAVREPQSAVSLVSTSTLVATALRVVTPTVDLTAVSTLTATAERLRIVSRDLTTTSTLTAAGVVTTFATAALPSVSTLTATATRTGVGVVEATLAATSTLTATAVRVKEAAADLAAVSTLTATAVRIPLSAANLVTASTLTATATRDAVAAATLTTAATLTATGVRVPQATSTLTAASTLTATGTVIGIGLVAATLATQSTLTATAVRTQLSTGALSASATLTATAVRAPQSAAALNASSTLTATGERIRPVAAGLTTTSTLSATAIRFGVGVGTVDLTTTSTLTATATRTAVVAAALTTASTLQAGGGAIQPSTVTLTTTATLTPVGERVVLATVAMTATSTLAPAGLPTRIAAATLTVTSVLSTAPVRMLFPAAAFVQLSVLTANGQRVIIGINTVNNRPVLVKVPGVGWVPISRAGV